MVTEEVMGIAAVERIEHEHELQGEVLAQLFTV